MTMLAMRILRHGHHRGLNLNCKILGIKISVTLSKKNLLSLYKDNAQKDSNNCLQARTPSISVQDRNDDLNISEAVSADFISNQSDHIVENLINPRSVHDLAVADGQRTSAHVSQPTPMSTEHASASQGPSGVPSSSSNMEHMIMTTLQLCQQTIKQVSNAQSQPPQLDSSSAGYNLQSAMSATSNLLSSGSPMGSYVTEGAQVDNRNRTGSLIGLSGIRSAFGVPASSVSAIDMVSPEIQDQITSSKDVNLNILLIPNYENQSKKKITETDERLNRSLSLDEFIVAFGWFKRIMCSVHSWRAEDGKK